jgi:hypothetical protein
MKSLAFHCRNSGLPKNPVNVMNTRCMESVILSPVLMLSHRAVTDDIHVLSVPFLRGRLRNGYLG